MGFSHYQNGKYEDAVHFFRYLTLIDCNKPRNWLGLGACYQMIKEYHKALQSFAFTAKLNTDDPMPHLYASECFTSIGEQAKKKEALNLAEKLALKDKEKFKDLLDHIRLIKGGINADRN